MTRFQTVEAGLRAGRATRRGEGGVALISTLMLLSAIAVLVVAFFALARMEVRTSAHFVDSFQADLAAQSAFEEAKNVLLRNTMNDEYVVTMVRPPAAELDDDYYGNRINSRYLFISKPDGSGVEHVPLFAGGVRQRSDSASASSAVRRRPGYELDGGVDVAEAVIENLWLNSINDEGNVMPVESRPYTGYLEPEEQDPNGERVRYSYWIEDMQGYPNIEVSGGWTDHHKHNNNRYTRDALRLGYGPFDERTKPGDAGPEGMRVDIDDSARGRQRFGYQFPKFFRGQTFLGQVAPGLSPREIHVHGWLGVNSDGDQYSSNFWVPDYLSRRHALMSNYGLATFGRYVGNRFVVGLRPYRERLMIPRGFGYADEGRPRVNINDLIASGDVGGIAGHINRNLPEFAERKGGFPEDYVQTLAASIVDYADRDSEPTVMSGVYRGVDSYPFVNEFIFKFEYLGYVVNADSFTVRFEGTPYVEVWNPSDQPLSVSDLSLNFGFIQLFAFQIPDGTRYEFDEASEIRNAPKDASVGIQLDPNEYRVVGGPNGFGSIVWEFEVPRSPEEGAFTLESVFGLTSGGKTTGDTRGYFELVMDGNVIDRAGVRGAGTPNDKVYPVGRGRPLRGRLQRRRERARGRSGATRARAGREFACT
ncbi:MAG: hypothetical protein AAF591_20490, partial [Verrucomicrobiota bacterium]